MLLFIEHINLIPGILVKNGNVESTPNSLMVSRRKIGLKRKEPPKLEAPFIYK
jgi:hypothetical protein